MDKTALPTNDPFAFTFGTMKVKYADYDELLTRRNLIKPNDKINVFINLETGFRNLSVIQDLERKIMLHDNFETLIVSSIINLAGHYKRFFKGNGLDANIYLYNTDLTSNEFAQFKYNEDYRSYYLTKFNSNPKYSCLTESLLNGIIPSVKTICDYIPNVYYISAKNIEGSLVPFIIGKKDTSKFNIVMGGEFYDTQYSGINKFINVFIHRGFVRNAGIYSSIPEYITVMSKKKPAEIENLCKIYNMYNMYCALMSSLGDRDRSIDGLNKIGLCTLEKYIMDGLATHKIEINTTNPEILGEVFDNKDLQEEFVQNYYCTSLPYMYKELTDSDKDSIFSQIIDRSDINSLMKINHDKFDDYPLIMEALLC